ncbi:MAG: hypothetical protein AAGC93_07445 [Cyanobacteria bacterium P01_F01_bin.53]
MKKHRLIIQNLDNLQALSLEEISSVRGSLSIAYPEPAPQPPKDRVYFPDRPHPKWPKHPSPRPKPYPRPYPIPCSPYPTKGGSLPWCAVIL